MFRFEQTSGVNEHQEVKDLRGRTASAYLAWKISEALKQAVAFP
jgi:hypothetical protein